MLKATTEVNKHSHLINLNTMECSFTKKHRHGIDIDPQTKSPILIPADDGHTHDIIELVMTEPQYPKNKQTDTEIMDDIMIKFREGYDFEIDSVTKGQESIDFLEGSQWSDEIKAKLASNNRAALTINHIAPMVETLSGVARQQRTDLKALPVENGDQFAADVFTASMKQILVQNAFEFEEIEVLEDEIVTGRGVFEVYVDYDENIEGNIKVRRIPWDMVTVAPHNRKDLSDAEYIFKWKWISENQLKNLYPDSKDSISQTFMAMSNDPTFGYGNDTFTRDNNVYTNLFANPLSKQIRLLECESKEYYTKKIWIDITTAETYAEDEMPKGLAKQLRTLKGLNLVSRRLFRLRKTVTAGNLVLEDDYLESPIESNLNGNPFSIVVVYAYKRGSYFEGKVERMKDPQRELNKRRSQTVDIVNTTINNGWFYGEQTFKDRVSEENFKNNSSSAGFVQKIADIERPPIKVESGVVERGIVELEMNSQRSLREITNINTELLGQAPSYQSGVALQHQQRAALVGNEYLFDNLNRGKKEIGKRIIGWIQKIYSPQRIAKLVLNQATVEKVFIDKEELKPKDKQSVLAFLQKVEQVLRNPEQLEFNIAIGESNSTPTTQLANFQLVQQLIQSGAPIPTTLLLEYAPLPNKEMLMQQLQQQQQMEQQKENQKYQTEIIKTQIAHDSKKGE